MKKRPLTYKKAGVDIEKAEKLIKEIKKIAKTTSNFKMPLAYGGFGAAFDFYKLKIKEPVLVSSSDGVGTKLKVAFLANKHDTIGIDLVAMNVNDILTSGARPLFFLDYIATSKINNRILTSVVKGISRGCQEAGCSLIGGETAELPDFYKKGEYDLAGFCVGVIEKKKILKPSDIKEKDLVIGLASSGLHSNGFSLVRKVFSLREQRNMARELLKPTKIYVKPVLSLLNKVNTKTKKAIKAMAHVTGGAFYEKVSKTLTKDKDIVIYKHSWPIPKIFNLIKEKGHLDVKEIFRVFNMGVGFVLIIDREKSDFIIRHFKNYKIKSWVIGEVTKGKGQVIIT